MTDHHATGRRLGRRVECPNSVVEDLSRQHAGIFIQQIFGCKSAVRSFGLGGAAEFTKRRMSYWVDDFGRRGPVRLRWV